MWRFKNMNEEKIDQILTNQHVIMDFLSGGIAKESFYLSMNKTCELLYPLKEPTLRKQTKDAFCEESLV